MILLPNILCKTYTKIGVNNLPLFLCIFYTKYWVKVRIYTQFCVQFTHHFLQCVVQKYKYSLLSYFIVCSALIAFLPSLHSLLPSFSDTLLAHSCQISPCSFSTIGPAFQFYYQSSFLLPQRLQSMIGRTRGFLLPLEAYAMFHQFKKKYKIQEKVRAWWMQI